MSSKRTVQFGDAKISWITKDLYKMYFSHDLIRKWHKTYIKPKFKIKDYSEIRIKAFDIIHDSIINKNVSSMLDLVNILIAMRMTTIDCNTIDNNGNLEVLFMVPNNEKYERITFENIIWHINHHCRQLHLFCFVQAIEKYTGEEIAISYTTAEWKDKRHWDGIDTQLKYDDIKKEYHPSKKWEDK